MGNKISDHIFYPLETKRAYTEISERIKQAIFDGKLKTGDQLPSEITMSKDFQVSRQTVREALRLLEISGFVTFGRGSTGRPIIEKTILHAVSNAFLNALQMKNVTLSDLTIARIEIEKNIIHYAIRNADQKSIDALLNNCVIAKKKLAQGIFIFPENIEFHLLLAKASKNPVFVVIIKAILALAAEYISRSEFNLEASRKAYEDHLKIINAVVNRNTETAMHLIQDHIQRIGNTEYMDGR
jgi:DNA-binding FadR family transcriptional regulator